MNKITKLLGQIQMIAYIITRNSDTDVFVSYNGHVQGIIVYYYEFGYSLGGYKTELPIAYLDNSCGINSVEKIKELRRELLSLAKEKGVEIPTWV